MTTSVSAYTNLESLLLFQCLHAYGVGPSVFTRISDLLKKNPDITTHKYFQAGRLSPDALRNFYLERLKRELELEHAADNDAPNADQASPTKRKRQSPSLPTVHESLQHQHLIPKLVTKLYASYRYEIAEQIRAEEDRYERLQRELKSIERGEWDDQLREKLNGQTSALRSPAPPRKSPHLAQKPLQSSQSPQPVQNGARRGPLIAPSPDAAHTSGLESPRSLPGQNGQPSPSQSQRHPSTPQPHPTPPPPASHQGQTPKPHTVYNNASYPNVSPFPQSQTPQNVQSQSGPHQYTGHMPQPPSSVAGSSAPQYQSSPVQNHGGNGVPPYGPPGAHPQYPIPHQQFPHQQPAGPHSPSLHSGQQQRSQYPHSGHQSYPPLQPQMPHPPPQAGFMLPPFQVAPQDPSRVHHQTAAPPPPPTQTSTPTSSRQPSRANLQTPGSGRAGAPPMHPLVTQARQSLSTPSGARSPQSSMGTPVSAKTHWKRSSLNGTQSTSSSPRPEVEPLDDVPPLVRPKQSPTKAKSQRKSRSKAKAKEADQESVADVETPQNTKQVNDHEEESLLEPETRSGRSRRKAPARRTRPGSIASSRAGGSVRDRSRSQSILSHTDTVAADNESQTGNRIKSERGTSVDAIDEEVVVETPSHMSTRRRGAAPASSLSTRRKRNAREASLEETEDRSFGTPGPPRSIIAPRNFARMAAPIMYDINSHKHASTFNTAVRAKDAEGYYDIIKRPTDLSSIKKAIAAGSKQVAAAAAASENPTASPGGATGGVVELPYTADNVPPKAIVNAAQLEKELMRMFVNAVMFNPGEEGVVNDARDMFQTVQGLVSTWRDVERDSGKGNEGTPAAEDEEPPTASKRRKL